MGRLSLQAGSFFSRGAGLALTLRLRNAVVVREVTASDEAALDRNEGFPHFYYKRDIRLKYKGIRTGKHRTVTAFDYIMHEDRPVGVPSDFYMRTCLEGYDTFRFDKNILVNAYDKYREVCGYEE